MGAKKRRKYSVRMLCIRLDVLGLTFMWRKSRIPKEMALPWTGESSSSDPS